MVTRSIAHAAVLKDRDIFFLSKEDGFVSLKGNHGSGVYVFVILSWRNLCSDLNFIGVGTARHGHADLKFERAETGTLRVLVIDIDSDLDVVVENGREDTRNWHV